MAHVHAHEEDSHLYYLEQLFMVGICGALGGVAVMMWWQDKLKYILALPFHPYVLAGGIVLLLLVAVRALSLWNSAGQFQANHDHNHDHDHHHDHDHDHGHEHHHHDHGHPHDHGPSHAHGADHHGHDHGSNPWRYIVLMLPVVLYFLNLPNQGFSSTYIKKGPEVEAGSFGIVQGEKVEVIPVEFKELERAAYTSATRQGYDGKYARIKGQFVPSASGNDKMFSLVRFKITCCAADAVQLNLIIMLNPDSTESVSDIQPLQWVDVTGKIQFRKKKDRDEYVSVLLVPAREQIRPTAADPNPYVQ